jgi:hypothetical protein
MAAAIESDDFFDPTRSALRNTSRERRPRNLQSAAARRGFFVGFPAGRRFSCS